jgi:hypothetical protein
MYGRIVSIATSQHSITGSQHSIITGAATMLLL